MSVRLIPSVALALAASLVLLGPASAQERHLRHARVTSHHAVVLAEIGGRPLTVQKRSFLDPGNMATPSTDTPEYLAANTTELVPVYQSYAPARFGESTLAGWFDLPYNPRYEPNRDIDFSPF